MVLGVVSIITEAGTTMSQPVIAWRTAAGFERHDKLELINALACFYREKLIVQKSSSARMIKGNKRQAVTFKMNVHIFCFLCVKVFSTRYKFSAQELKEISNVVDIFPRFCLLIEKYFSHYVFLFHLLV